MISSFLREKNVFYDGLQLVIRCPVQVWQTDSQPSLPEILEAFPQMLRRASELAMRRSSCLYCQQLILKERPSGVL